MSQSFDFLHLVSSAILLRMAKKRKQSKKTTSKKGAKSKAAASSLPENFWSQAFSLILILVAALMFIGSLNTGGPLALKLHDWARFASGSFSFVLPLVLVFVAVVRLRSETTRLPRSTMIGLFVFLASVCGFLHLFIDSAESLAAVDNGQGGGIAGHVAASGLLTILNTFTAGLLLIVAIVISLHYVLSIPLTTFMRAVGIMRRERAEGEEEDESEQEEEKKPEFTLNEGVPVQRSRGLRSLKDTAERAMESESGVALVTTSDPNWKFPGLDLLNKKQDTADAGDIEGNAKIIKETLEDFGINVEMQGANVGPRVTQFTLTPPSGVRLTKITALENNLALNLAAHSIRIEAPIPGKRAVGIEVPNQKAATVRLHDIFKSNDWTGLKTQLAFVVGKDISGQPVVADLTKMPHLLIAGATGSGKSVMINSFLLSLLYRNSPADMKLIMVDPKHVELTPYNEIPHLLTPVITDPEKCISALKWAVAEMDRRYHALSEAKKRNIAEYNELKKEEGMPYIVIVIDELADLMMLAARDVEALIVRLAQKARAVGIHLVLATQRPSVDVITGLIKANVPARIAFTVTSQVDSRTILDGMGAEKLLGQGDMLYTTPDIAKPRRIQGALVDDKEVGSVADFLRDERAPEYDDEVTAQPVQLAKGGMSGSMDSADDSLYQEAVKVVVESGKASASLLQRRLRVGYARAARLIETMEEQGIVGQADGARPRDVLISSVDQFADDSSDDDQPLDA